MIQYRELFRFLLAVTILLVIAVILMLISGAIYEDKENKTSDVMFGQGWVLSEGAYRWVVVIAASIAGIFGVAAYLVNDKRNKLLMYAKADMPMNPYENGRVEEEYKEIRRDIQEDKRQVEPLPIGYNLEDFVSSF